MAINQFLGSAIAIAQISTWTPASVTVGNIFTITLTAEDGVTTGSVAFTASAGTVANVTAGLSSLASASTNLLFTAVTWVDNGTNLQGTAITAGIPIHGAGSAATGGGSGGCSLTYAVTTANSGPSDWNVTANWSTGSVPITGDSVYIENISTNVLYGLYQAGVTLASLNIAQTMTGTVGSVLYYLKIGATICNIGYNYSGNASGSGRIKINFGSVATSILVSASGASMDANLEPVRFLGSNSSNVLNVNSGFVGVARTSVFETSTFSSINVLSGQVNIGAGVNVTNIVSGTVVNSSIINYSNNTVTTTEISGQYLYLGSGAHTTLQVYEGGAVAYDGIGTIGTADVYGTLNFTGDMRSKTVTNCTVYKGGSLLTDNGIPNSIIFTNPIAISGNLNDVTVNFGQNVQLVLSY